MTEDVMVSDSSYDVSTSGVLMESVRIEFKPSSKPANAWSRKEYSSDLGSRGKWVNDDTLPVNVGTSNKLFCRPCVS